MKMSQIIDHILDMVIEIPYAIHSAIGFIIGIFGTAPFLTNGEVKDILVSFIIGMASALGAAGTKFTLSLFKRKKDGKDK